MVVMSAIFVLNLGQYVKLNTTRDITVYHGWRGSEIQNHTGNITYLEPQT